MGYYINPAGMTQTEFLTDNGDLVQPIGSPPESYKYKDKVAVCLIDNVAFTAAIIAYSLWEFEEIKNPLDTRAKVWFMVPIEVVKPFMGGRDIV